jgi:hypothetical protein
LQGKDRGMREVAVEDVAVGIILHSNQMGWHRKGVDVSCQGVDWVGVLDEVLWAVDHIMDERNRDASRRVVEHSGRGHMSAVGVVVDQNVFELARMGRVEGSLVGDLAIGEFDPQVLEVGGEVVRGHSTELGLHCASDAVDFLVDEVGEQVVD